MKSGIDFSRSSESGFIALGLIPTAVKIGGAALAACFGVGALLGVAHNFNTDVSFGTEAGVTSSGTGVLTGVYTIPRKTCYAAYTNDVNGVRARAEITGEIGPYVIPAGRVLWWESELNGNVTTIVCITDQPGSREEDLSSGEVTIDLSDPDTFQVTNYFTPTGDPDNPMARRTENDHSPLILPAQTLDAIIKSFTEGNLGIDGIYSQLQNLTEAEAYHVSAQACGAAAWEHLVPLLEEAIKQEEIEYTREHDPASDISPDDISVKLPEEVAFQNQYFQPDKEDDEAKKFFENLTTSSVSQSPSPDTITCDEAPDLRETLADYSATRTPAEGTE